MIRLHKGSFRSCCCNCRHVIAFIVLRKITASRENSGELLGDQVIKTALQRIVIALFK